MRHNRFGVLTVFGLLWASAAWGQAVAPASGPGSAERIVIVIRHGVRSPTQTPASMAAYSAQTWPDWRVAPGELTPHGASALRLLAGWMRQHYATDGVWPASGCPLPGAVYLYSDGKDHRTVDSGQAFLDGAFPGCGLAGDHGPAGALDPVFGAAESGICPIDPAAARTSVATHLPGGLAAPMAGYHEAMDALAQVLNGAKPECARRPGQCFETGENTLVDSRQGLRLVGPLATASLLAESLNLEYLEGMSGDALGWGRLDQGRIRQVMQLHNTAAAMLREDPVIAGHEGGLLARAVLQALSGQAAFPGQHGHAAQVTVVMGHDKNVANLAGILGLTWRLPDEPDRTPPGGALVIRASATAPGQDPTVSAYFVAQTAAQIHDLRKLDGRAVPSEIKLVLPGCTGEPGGICTLRRFGKVISAHVPAECRAQQ